jgi:hypothetical protein
MMIFAYSARLGNAGPPLKVVILENPNTTDSDVAKLVRPKDAREVWAEGLPIGRLAVEHLGRCRQLEKVYLGSTDVSDAEMPVLATLPHLKDLHLPNTSVSDAGLRALRGCVTLKQLDVCGTHVTERGVEEIRSQRPGLHVYWSTVASEAVRNALVELQRMNVDVGCHDWSGAPLRLGTSKTRAFCSVNFLNHWDGDAKKANGILKVVAAGQPGVCLHVSSFKQPGLEVLRDLRQLLYLTITVPGLTDKDLSLLRTIGSVENLNLSSPGLTDEALRYVAEIPSLGILSIQGFSDEGIDRLAQLPTLTKLGISGPTFSEEALEHCAKLPHLKRLAVLDCKRISDTAKVRFFLKHPQICRDYD